MHKRVRKLGNVILFIGPNYIGFLIFTLLPMIFAIILSFFSWNIQSGIDGLQFVGIDNFKQLAKDKWFMDSLINNLYVVIVTVPLSVLLGVTFASVLNKKVYFKNTIRAALFLPYIANIVAVCYAWIMIFEPNYGIVNGLLGSIGIKNLPGWLSSSTWAMPTIMLQQLWVNVGYCMIIYLAGIQQIPKSLKEAAKIDGATKFQEFRYVTWPLLSPTTFFIVIIMIINSFKMFSPVNIMTDGGPGSSTSVLAFYTYISAFRFYKMGYASSIATVLFIIIFIITYIQWQGQKKWVNYM